MSRRSHSCPPGASLFFTACLAQPGRDLLVAHVDVLREAVRYVRALKGFRIDAWVTLPDHFHCVLTLAPDASDASNVIGGIKARFTRDVRRAKDAPLILPDDEAPIWRRGFRSRVLEDASAIAGMVSYCNLNPVRHGLVTDPFDWPYSSIHRDMKAALRQGHTRRNTMAPVGRAISGPDGAMARTGGAPRQRATPSHAAINRPSDQVRLN